MSQGPNSYIRPFKVLDIETGALITLQAIVFHEYPNGVKAGFIRDIFIEEPIYDEDDERLLLTYQGQLEDDNDNEGDPNE